MSISPRSRFEVLKRDLFTCRYCGRTSPSVVLEVDHIVPVSNGGSNDPINLATSCWDCNRGKAHIPLSEVMTGEDPHDRAILILERERQLREYNEVLSAVRERVKIQTGEAKEYWESETGRRIYGAEETGLENALLKFPLTVILNAFDLAIRARKTASLAYVYAVLNNAKAE